MFLLIDAGNSSIKWNVYDAPSKQFQLPPQAFLWRTDDLTTLLDRHWGGLNSIDEVLIANVAGHAVELGVQQWLTQNRLNKKGQLQKRPHSRGLEATRITTQSQAFGVRNAYKDPSQLGVDRWLAILAAAKLQPAQNLCCVSCGTAITVDTLTAQGDYRGGLIIPGPQLMKKALLQQTHGVKIGLDPVNDKQTGLSPFTDSTGAAVNHGVLTAAVGFIDRAINEIESELGGEVTKIITGGDAQTIRAHSRNAFVYEPELVLKGLALYADEKQ
jgi:type III pantothenate kinase